MGLYASLHIAPYILTTPTKKEEKHLVRTCLTDKCGKNGRKAEGKFCGSCGKEYGDKPMTRLVESVNYHELMEEIGEALFVPPHNEYLVDGSHVWVLNVTRYAGIPDIDEGEPAARDLSRVDINAEIQKFETAFAKELKVIREAYGEQHVKVCFGVVQTVF